MNTAVIDELLTIRDWIRWASSEFSAADLYFGHGTDNAWDEAVVLVLGMVKQPWEALEAVMDTRLTKEEKVRVFEAIEIRIQRRLPVAYLTGEASFANLQFHVTEDVLVPRSPIAELILNQFQPWLETYPNHILDMCTGSGCIGIACSSVFPDADVDLVDYSEKALIIAKKNIERYKLNSKVQAILSDLFENVPFENVPKERYELIVSNPPYVDEKDLASMPAEYRAEPSMGLGSGADGLDITRRILSEVSNFLTPNGLLVVEVGNSWQALEEAFLDVPFLWPELENGGHGVFVLTAEQVKAYF